MVCVFCWIILELLFGHLLICIRVVKDLPPIIPRIIKITHISCPQIWIPLNFKNISFGVSDYSFNENKMYNFILFHTKYTGTKKKRRVVSSLSFIKLTHKYNKPVAFSICLTGMQKFKSSNLKKIVYKTICPPLFKNSFFGYNMKSLFLFSISLTALCWQKTRAYISELYLLHLYLTWNTQPFKFVKNENSFEIPPFSLNKEWHFHAS